MSTEDRPVGPYFILLDFDGIQDPERRSVLNQIPASFSLSDEQVDLLIRGLWRVIADQSRVPAPAERPGGRRTCSVRHPADLSRRDAGVDALLV